MASDQVRAYFDTRAGRFDRLYRDDSRLEAWVNRTFRQAVYQRFRITLAESGDVTGASVLDVGCGPGRYAIAYAKLGAARVVGVDVAEQMLDLARTHAAANEVADRCHFARGDFLATPFDERFDVVLAIGVFDYLPEAVPFLRRMVELSRRRVIATFPGRSPLRMRFRRLRYAARGVPVFFYRADEVEALARAAGLSRFTLVPLTTSGTGYVLVGDIGG
jgi:ubiquinone/menaquinone biosynthesis C-methylase UbiE